MTRRRIAILISGRGSNSLSLMGAARAAGLPGRNRPRPFQSTRGRRSWRSPARPGIEALAIDHTAYADRAGFDAALDAALVARNIDLICLAGFMRVLTSAFVERWAGRMINIHPSLLPLFRGTNTHQRALDAGVLVHGCTVHFVVPELDAGPIVAQAVVPVVPGDNAADLAARVLAQEHLIYPRALRMICEGKARLENGRVIFTEGWSAGGCLRSPG